MTQPVTVIDLRDGEGFDNRRKVINLLSESNEFIWIANWYFEPKHLEIFSAVLKENPKINEIRLLLNAPSSTDDLEDLKLNFKLFQKQFKKIRIDIKFITNNKLKKSIHDRFYYTKDQAWNFIEFDTLLRGQRATISLLDPKEFEKNSNLDFLKRWNDEKTYDIFSQWEKLLEIVKKREEILKQKSEESKKNASSLMEQNSKTTFYVYKTNKEITIESKERVLIEVDEAIKELKNLEPDPEPGTSYVGFCNMSTNESLQFIRKDEKEWYADVPIHDGPDWEGYAYKVYGTWDEMQKTVEAFFAEKSFRVFLPWKITRLKKWLSDEAIERDEIQREKIFRDLK